MATVVGKTSVKIDELLGGLVLGAEVVDGQLILTTRNGTKINAGGVGGSSSIARLFYTNGSYPTRPSATLCVEWVGPTQPPGMTDKDTWVMAP